MNYSQYFTIFQAQGVTSVAKASPIPWPLVGVPVGNTPKPTQPPSPSYSGPSPGTFLGQPVSSATTRMPDGAGVVQDYSGISPPPLTHPPPINRSPHGELLDCLIKYAIMIYTVVRL